MHARRIALVAIAALLIGAGASLAQYASSNYFEAGTQRLNIGGTAEVVSGGTLNILSGGQLKVAGVDKTAALGAAVPNPVAGPSAGARVIGGQMTTATATDTVATGLSTVIGCVASYDTDPADANDFVSCTVGNQSGAPAAGSIIIKTWKTGDGADVTPVAASAFSKKVNWFAFGS